jgi:hypothetical protein
MKTWVRTCITGALWALGAAAIGWWTASPVTLPEETRLAARNDWQLPSLPARRLGPERVAVGGTAPYWGTPSPLSAPAAAALAPVRPPSWRLAGVVGQGSSRRVLLLYAPESGKPSELLKVGDKLPTDHVISQIKEKSICVQIGKKTFELGLESIEAGP